LPSKPEGGKKNGVDGKEKGKNLTGEEGKEEQAESPSAGGLNIDINNAFQIRGVGVEKKSAAAPSTGSGIRESRGIFH